MEIVEVATLTLDERERKLLSEWNEKHLRDHHSGDEPYAGAIGGRIAYMICYTSLGQVVRAVCGICERSGIEKDEYSVDMSDYDSW